MLKVTQGSGLRRSSHHPAVSCLPVCLSSPWALPCCLAPGMPPAQCLASSQMQEMRCVQSPESTKPLTPLGWVDLFTHTHSFTCQCQCVLGTMLDARAQRPTRPFPALQDLPASWFSYVELFGPGSPASWFSCVETFGPGSPASNGSVFSENRL